MLENLARIDWGKLSHAYGPATDVPDQLRALASPDAGVRDKALWQLYGNIFHQGTRWQASRYAVPFLFELLENPATPERHKLVYLLVHLALGYEEQYLPWGIELAEAFAEAEELRKRDDLEELSRTETWEELATADEEKWETVNRLPTLWACDTYRAVAQRADRFLALTDDGDAEVRLAAVYALAWFPEAAPRAVPRVRRIAAEEGDPLRRANALLCLGLLGRYLNDRADGPGTEVLLVPDHPFVVRVAAALALTTLLEKGAPAQALAVLVEAVRDAERLQTDGQRLPWNEGDLVGYAAVTLHAVGLEDKDRAVTALCEALKAVKPLASVTVTGALLGLLFPEPPAGGRRDPRDLTPLQRQALRAVARYGAWRFGTASFGNYVNLVAAFGLPGSPEQLREFLNEAERA
jgi:HEAT repeat protein